MSFSKASDAFEDIQTVIGKPRTDTERCLWNLALGLTELSQALQQDLREIRKVVDLIYKDLP